MISEQSKKIIKLSKKYKNVELAKMFNLTPERIRQILKKYPIKFCKIHKRKYAVKEGCKLCYILNYYNKLLDNNSIMEEIIHFRAPDRRIESVYMKVLLIRYLRNKLNKSFNEIGKLLERDHTSIINLYYKKI